MKKFLVCAALATATTTLHAGVIYSAYLGCFNTCVTTAVSWASEPPVYFVDVEDSLGNVLFPLTLGPFFGASDGQISPFPQTIFNLTQYEVNLISNGQASVGVSSIAPAVNSFSTLDLKDQNGNTFFSERFVASLQVPEPAVWSLTGAGMALLFLWKYKRRRRNSQT